MKVDLRSWTEVKSFFGRGSDERIFVVRRDDEQNTIIQFGDGVRGARVPSGAEVVANYRVGSGYDFPPAGAIAQISRPFVGLRSVRSPIAAEPGSNPDTAKTLRTHAPRSMLLFGRAVSVRDFETLANLTKGVIKAVAEFLWLEAEQSAGVQVTYIGDAKPEELTQRLRERAERNLTIRVEQAAGWVSELNIDVVHDSNFAAEVVARDVKQKLSHPETGILSRAQAEIGGQLWVSRIYQEVQSVAGVVNVQSIVLGVPSSSPLQIQRAAGATLSGVAASKFTVKKALWANNSVSRVLQALGRKDVVCTPPGTFLDFGEGTRVTVTSNSSVVVDLRTRRPTEEV